MRRKDKSVRVASLPSGFRRHSYPLRDYRRLYCMCELEWADVAKTADVLSLPGAQGLLRAPDAGSTGDGDGSGSGLMDSEGRQHGDVAADGEDGPERSRKIGEIA